MRRSFKILLWLLALMVVAVLALGTLMLLDRQPIVPADPAVSEAEQAWVRQWLATNRPRARQTGKRITLTLSEREANLILNELLDQFGQGQATVHLEAGRARLRVSLAMPWDQLGGFINLELVLVEGAPLPKVEAARLAGLPLPGALVQTLADRALTAADRTQLFESVELKPDQARITYIWRPDLLERLGSGFVAGNELPRLLHYQARLAEKVASVPRGQPLRLAELLAFLLNEARSQPASVDPITENRAVILVLAAYVNGRAIRDPADSATAVTPPRQHSVRLRGRRDLAQHFMTSAALAIQGNDALSTVLGWYKEMSDSNGGSGFSFADMAANRAGIRFATLATASNASARRVQAFAAPGWSEDDFMPAIDGLPEGMDQREFAAAFGNPQSSEYQRMVDDIDRRIDARRLFRQPPDTTP